MGPHAHAAPLLRTRVPGSTSNLGPGFDLLGLALSLHLEVQLERIETGETHVVRTGEGEVELAGGSPDLLLSGLERAAREQGAQGPFRISAHSTIPVGRGFGSSGAAVAAGLLLGSALGETPIARDELLAWGIELEGHPDNVTASLFGGCTLCHPDPDGGPAHFGLSVHSSIAFALAWPEVPLSTDRAREALPPRVSRTAARENPRRLAFLLEGLRTGDPRWLAIGTEDHLHVPHRLPLILGAARALEAAHDHGAWTATISGAGSGLVALGSHEEIAAVAAAMAQAFEAETGSGSSRVVHPETLPPQVQSLSST